jgi:hypothetical protein
MCDTSIAKRAPRGSGRRARWSRRLRGLVHAARIAPPASCSRNRTSENVCNRDALGERAAGHGGAQILAKPGRRGEVATFVAIRESEPSFAAWRAQLRMISRQLPNVDDPDVWRREAQSLFEDALVPQVEAIRRTVSRSRAPRCRERATGPHDGGGNGGGKRSSSSSRRLGRRGSRLDRGCRTCAGADRCRAATHSGRSRRRNRQAAGLEGTLSLYRRAHPPRRRPPPPHGR